MYKLIARQQGVIQSMESFNSFQGLKHHLVNTDYFSWILDNEHDKELPNFQDVESMEDIQKIFEEFDYSWWTMEVVSIEGND